MLNIGVNYGFQASGSTSSFRTGSGVPSNTLGVNGDYYVDIDTLVLYQKNTGTYASVVTLNRLAQLIALGELRFGAGLPSNGLGQNSDYYVNTTNGDVYYKSAGVYSVIINIKGATGNGTTSGSYVPTAGLFASVAPSTLTDGMNRFGAKLKALNGNVAIP